MVPSPGKGNTQVIALKMQPVLILGAVFCLLALAQAGFCQGLPAPSELTALAGNGVVNLYWTPISSASPTCYFIYRDPLGTPTETFSPTPTFTPTPIGSFTPIIPYTITPTDSPTGTSTPMAVASTPGAFVDYQVANGVSYVYSVMGQDTNGILGAPATVGANPFAPPQAIQPVTVQALHAGALDLSWELPLSSYPVVGYSIYRLAVTFTITPTGSPTQVFTSTPTLSFTPSFTCTPTTTLPPGTYTYTPVNTFTPTVSFTPTITNTFTNTFTPTPTFPQMPIYASTVIAAGPPVTVVAGSPYSDQLQSLGPGEYYYVILGLDDHGNASPITYWATATPVPGGSPGPLIPVTIFSSLPNCPQFAKPLAPSLSGVLLATLTPAPPGNVYGVSLIWNGALASEGVTAYQVLSNGNPLTTVAVTPTPFAAYGYTDQTIPYSPPNQITPTSYSIIASNANGSVTSNALSENISQPSMNPGSVQVIPVATTQAVTVSWAAGNPGTYPIAGYQVFEYPNGIPATGTPTPTLLAAISINPGATPTLVYVDVSVPNAWGRGYWVQPFSSEAPGALSRQQPHSILVLLQLPRYRQP